MMKRIPLLCAFLFWALTAHAVTLDSNIDGGNGIADGTLESPAATLNIYTNRDDSTDSNYTDWFFFKLTDVQDSSWTVNVDFYHWQTSYWGADHGHIRPVWSYDGETWNRLSSITSYSNGLLTFQLPTMEQNAVYVAMDVPYTYTDLQSDVAAWESSPYCTAAVLSYGGISASQGGRNMYHLRIEEPGHYTNRLNLVITARAHPGEPQASHHLKGMIDWILSSDPTAVDFRRRVTLDVFPMLNPDGVYHGRLRNYNDTFDANRQFDPIDGPDINDEPPETFLVHSKIHELRTETDYAIDLHSSNWSYPAITEDQTTIGVDAWSSADKSALLAALADLDTGDYWSNSVANYDTDYTTTWRHGQPYQYGYQTLISEGGIYTDNSGAYPTATKRQAGGAHFLQAFVDALDGGVTLAPGPQMSIGGMMSSGVVQ